MDMRVYHGSDQIVMHPRILEPNRRMDFGRGFYTTESEKQAGEWAVKIKDRRDSEHAFISIYDYETSSELKTLRFDGPSEEWFDFVYSNRYDEIEHDYDIIIGPVADDGVVQTLFRYYDGVITKEQAIVELKTTKFDGQVLFHTNKSLEQLTYIGYREVE